MDFQFFSSHPVEPLSLWILKLKDFYNSKFEQLKESFSC